MNPKSFASALLASLLAVAAGAADITVSDKVAVSQPVSPMLYGGYAELGFGRSDNLQSELLFDRGFELTGTYMSNGWLQHVRAKPELEDWWHSGYEENRWYLAKAPQDTASVFQKGGEGYWPAGHGKFFAWIHNKSKEAPVSLAQDGIRVRPGIAYTFSGLLCDGTVMSPKRQSAHPVEIEIGLYPERQLDQPPFSSAKLVVDSATLDRYTVTLPACDKSGRATFAIKVGPGRRLAADMLSLQPSDQIDGFRREVVEAMRTIPHGIIRWPGGCYASTYDWRDGIGPLDERPVSYTTWWGCEVVNDLGTAEFVRLCRLTGTEPMLCVPVMFGRPENAADWVAFCNAPSHLLRPAGSPPLNVKYWEMDNEPYRRLDAIGYARRCVEFSKAMKAVDPSIQIVMGNYWSFHPQFAEMLEIAGPHVDIITNRGGSIAEMRQDIALLEAYNARHQRHIGLCHTEYRANNFDPTAAAKAAVAAGADGLNVPAGQGDPKESIFNKECRWAYGLGVLCDFLDYQGMGGIFRFAIFTNTIDGWGENLINAGKDRVYLSAAGQAIAFLQRQPVAWPLETTLAKADPTLKVEAAWDANKTTLTLIVLNLSGQPRDLGIDIAPVHGQFAPEAAVDQLAAPTPETFNTEANPDRIVRTAAVLKTDGKTLTHTFAPYSATAIRLVPR